MRAPLALAALAALLWSSAARAQPVFTGDPIDPSTGKAYMIFPGLPLIYPGPDGVYGTADDVVAPALVGDVDVVIRSGGTFTGGTIPPPAAGVAAAPEVIAGGRHGGAGTEVAFQMILSDGTTPPAAGAALLGPELNARRGLVVAYADLDGDGFIGPTATASGADLEIERQEALSFAGRTMFELQNGVGSGQIGVGLGAPASSGGLGIVLGGGAATGATPNLYADGPWVATLLPHLVPLNQAQIVGGENTGPVDPITLVDLELAPGSLYLPPPNTPMIGTPFAIPLDGSSVTNDLLRAVSGPAVGAAFGRPIDRATFVAQMGRRVLPAVDTAAHRTLIEPVETLALPADGAGNAQTVVVFPADLLGNPTDPPAGGSTITLEVGPALRISSPDTDGDPRHETLTFTSAAFVPVTIDDAGGAQPAAVTDQLLALRAGVPTGMVTVTITPGPGGGGGSQPGSLGALAARITNHGGVGRDGVRIGGTFAGDPTALDPTTQMVTVTLAGPGGSFYGRTLAAGTIRASASGRSFTFVDATTRLAIRRGTPSPQAHAFKLQARRLDLSPAPASLDTLSATLTIGATTFEGSASCTGNVRGTIIRCP